MHICSEKKEYYGSKYQTAEIFKINTERFR